MTEGEPDLLDERCGPDAVGARAALLDFYGDYSMAFSSQFVASIFGLIAACALINAVSSYLMKESSLASIVSFIVISLFVFFGLVLAALHTYSRFRFYSDLASKIVGFPKCLRESAELYKIVVGVLFPTREVGLKEINDVYTKVKEHNKFPKSSPPFLKDYKIGKDHGFDVIFPVYEEIKTRKQNKYPLRKILDSKYLPIVIILGVIFLGILTYYPIIDRINFLRIW